jgi:hypothetical protein
VSEQLLIVPVTFADACAMVLRVHRHHTEPAGHMFSLGVVTQDGALHGVAITGRPVARVRQDGWTLEVTRVATDGTPNACSALYAAAWRATKEMGYRRLGTYIQSSEPGTSLVAAGWRLVGSRPPRKGWNSPSRARNGRGVDNTGRELWEAS